MSFWDLIDGLFRNPPRYIVAFIVLILVARVFSHITTTVERLETTPSASHKRLFAVLEIALFSFLAIIILELLVYESIEGGSAFHEWYKDWPFILLVLLVTTAVSLRAYGRLP